MMNIKMMGAAAVAAFAIGANAATFIGELYGYWYDDAEECELYKFEEAWKEQTDWRTDYVEVDGKKEPALFGYDGYAFPVTIKEGEKFSAEVIHGTATAKHIKSIKVLSDEAMYKRLRESYYYMDYDDHPWMLELWGEDGEADPTRAWILVEQNNVTSGATYTLDLSKAKVVDLRTGELSSQSITDYAAEYGVKLTGTRKLTESVWYEVAIEGGDKFPQRVWNICDPFYKDGNALDKICDRGGDDELIDALGLYFVTKKMTGAGTVEIPEFWKKDKTINGVAYKSENGDVFGTFAIKCGKANVKTGLAKVSMTVTSIFGKKKTFKSQAVNAAKDCDDMIIEWDGAFINLCPRDDEGTLYGVGDGAIDWDGNGEFDLGIWDNEIIIGGAMDKVASFNFEAIEDVINKTLDNDSVMTSAYTTEGEEVSTYKPFEFTMASKRWTLAKAASIRWKKSPANATHPGDWIINTSKGKTNIPSLKLTYNARTGFFKGSFNIYTNGGKKYSATVNGLVVDGIGYGQATIKKIGVTWPVTIE